MELIFLVLSREICVYLTQAIRIQTSRIPGHRWLVAAVWDNAGPAREKVSVKLTADVPLPRLPPRPLLSTATSSGLGPCCPVTAGREQGRARPAPALLCGALAWAPLHAPRPT